MFLTTIVYDHICILRHAHHFCPHFVDRRKMSSGGETALSRASYKSLKSSKAIYRKLEMEFSKMQPGSERRRLKSNDYKHISTSSSAASSDAENDSQIDSVLQQSRHQLEHTEALKVRRHLLLPADYVSATAY